MTTIEWNDFDSYALSGVGEALDAAGVDTSAPDYAAEQVPSMVADRRIATLCERGTGNDAGLFRFTFYFGNQRFRLVTDASGQPVAKG